MSIFIETRVELRPDFEQGHRPNFSKVISFAVQLLVPKIYENVNIWPFQLL